MEKTTIGIIFNIQRFSIHDGPGIRTTVFMKGCGMRCVWCHNPESLDGNIEIAYYADKCIGCGACIDKCPEKCHSIISISEKDRVHNGLYRYSRQNCTKCGKCADICYAEAMRIIGKSMTVDEVFAEIIKDNVFYETSGGGVTLSGGEPLFQPKFSIDILKRCKNSDINTCVETSGFSKPKALLEVAQYTDLFLFDIKETDIARHIEYTGVDNNMILENLSMLDKSGALIILRCPVIPGLNDREDHFAGIAQIANGLKNIQRIEIEPYHPLGLSKAQAIGKIMGYGKTEITKKEISEKWAESIRKYTDVSVLI